MKFHPFLLSRAFAAYSRDMLRKVYALCVQRQKSLLLSFIGGSFLACIHPLWGGNLSQPDPVVAPANPLSTSTDHHIQDLALTVADWLTLADDEGHVEDYENFLAAHPHWPWQRQFSTRLQKKLLLEQDLHIVRRICTTAHLEHASAIMDCFMRLPPDTQLMSHLTPLGVRAWENGNDSQSDEDKLLATFSSILTPQSSYKRFLRQEHTRQYSAAFRTLTYLPQEEQLRNKADLALLSNQDNARSLYLSLNKAQQTQPRLLLHYEMWLFKHKQPQEALTLWQQALDEDEKQHYSNEYWPQRQSLARYFITHKDGKAALFLAWDPQARGEALLDSEFLSGWIALRMLHNPALSASYFSRLTTSPSLITQARGYYWMGCAMNALHRPEDGDIYWMRAALFPSTFYGQMAASRLENIPNILLTPDRVPSITRALITLAYQHPSHEMSTGDEMPFATVAQILYDTGHRNHIHDFLITQTLSPLTAPQRRTLSQLSLQLDSPEIAVYLARLGTRDGDFIFPQGWPENYISTSSSLPNGLMASLIRQESSYNPKAVSYSNAIGLTQMKPATAAEMYHLIAPRPSPSKQPDLYDPYWNMVLGQTYLQQIGKRFNNNVTLMAAAYNAGPHRVTTWFDKAGDPNKTPHLTLDSMIDWIELIPDPQTRNYVQRIWENMTTYHILEKP